MRSCTTHKLLEVTLGIVLLSGLACATARDQAGDSIEWRTGDKTGNPFEIQLTGNGPDLKATLLNRSSTKQTLLHDVNLQASTLEILAANGMRIKHYDARMLMKLDNKPYCQSFQTVAPGKKLELGTIQFRKSRDGYSGQWGPFNFDELPAGEYRVRVIWHSDRGQCLDEGTGKMRALPSVWRGMVRSNQVILQLM
jgi:hypothetical protein